MASAAALQFVYQEEFILNERGMKLFTCSWLPKEREIDAIVFLCHGYGVDCSVYTRETGERLAKAGFAVYGIDYEGHGKSEGKQCYVGKFRVLVNDVVNFFNSVRAREEYKDKKAFLFGESMGGAVALHAHLKQPSCWDGAVLVAPMCKISEKIRPPQFVISILTKVAKIGPTWAIVPSGNVIDNAFKDPIKREAVRSNPYSYQGKPRLRTALELMNASQEIEDHLTEVSLPFLVLHGDADTVNDPEISKALYKSASSYDKSMKLYPDMWHALTAGESDENCEIVFRDIIDWLNARTGQVQEREITMKGQHDHGKLVRNQSTP